MVGLQHRARFDVELAGAVPGVRIFFGVVVPFALLGDDMKEHRTLECFDVLHDFNQPINIMAINRAEIREAQFFKATFRGTRRTLIRLATRRSPAP